jgi:hypothetical protein
MYLVCFLAHCYWQHVAGIEDLTGETHLSYASHGNNDILADAAAAGDILQDSLDGGLQDELKKQKKGKNRTEASK